MFLHLAQSISGQGRQDHKFLRYFERGERGAATLFQLRGVALAFCHDVGHGDLASDWAGLSGYGGFGDFGLFEEELFDFAGVDIEATRNDEVALAASESEVAVF